MIVFTKASISKMNYEGNYAKLLVEQLLGFITTLYVFFSPK